MSLNPKILAIRPALISESFEITTGEPPKIEIAEEFHIPIFGVLANQGIVSLFGQQGTSYDWIRKQVEVAMASPKVAKIVLDIDSPGGEVLGVDYLASYIAKCRSQKLIIARVNGLCCSGAYWLASAASSIELSSETCIVGSIGVVAEHVDMSDHEKQQGIKRTEIFAGKYKRIYSNTAPLTVEGKEFLQAQVDYFYSLFVMAVAQYRNLDIETVIASAEGREFIGSQAVAAKLVDVVFNPKEVKMENDEEKDKLQKELEAAKAEIARLQVLCDDYKKKAEASVSASTDTKASAEVAIQAERARMLALDEINTGGNSEIIFEAKQKGWTPEVAALQILRTQKKQPNGLQPAKIADSPASSIVGQSVQTDSQWQEHAKIMASAVNRK